MSDPTERGAARKYRLVMRRRNAFHYEDSCNVDVSIAPNVLHRAPLLLFLREAAREQGEKYARDLIERGRRSRTSEPWPHHWADLVVASVHEMLPYVRSIEGGGEIIDYRLGPPLRLPVPTEHSAFVESSIASQPRMPTWPDQVQ